MTMSAFFDVFIVLLHFVALFFSCVGKENYQQEDKAEDW